MDNPTNFLNESAYKNGVYLGEVYIWETQLTRDENSEEHSYHEKTNKKRGKSAGGISSEIRGGRMGSGAVCAINRNSAP